MVVRFHHFCGIYCLYFQGAGVNNLPADHKSITFDGVKTNCFRRYANPTKQVGTGRIALRGTLLIKAGSLVSLLLRTENCSGHAFRRDEAGNNTENNSVNLLKMTNLRRKTKQ